MQPLMFMVLALTLGGAPIHEVEALPITEAQVIEQELRDYPLLKEICRCESGLRQHYEDGTFVVGIVNNQDRGVCQINLDSHKDQLKEMNLDPDKLEDNIKYAKYLYDQNGTSDWRYSRACWSKQLGFTADN